MGMKKNAIEERGRIVASEEKREVPRGIEPRLKDLKSSVLTVTP